MKVLLRSDVTGIGRRGDIVDVAGGFARNYLFPESLAIKAPDKKSKDGSKPDAADTTNALFKVFDLVFIYFFVTVSASSFALRLTILTHLTGRPLPHRHGHPSCSL